MLRLCGVSKTYAGNVVALQNVNLEIPNGIFGLLGPNGAGKSTLMRTIATLQEPDDGTIHFDTIDVLKDKTALRRVLGYLPQEFGSYPRTSAEAMLLHFAALKGIHGHQRRQVVERLLVHTNLWKVRKRSVDKFSGGMKRRFGIAQALLGNPRLIIVDEPTAGLDPAERRRFQNLLAEVGEERVIILSTHIVDDVAALCSRIAILGRGTILADGEPAKLTAELNGKLWTVVASQADLARIRAEQYVISTRFRAGRTVVRIIADDKPEGATAAVPELEDVYFRVLIDHGLTDNLE
ncbi:MAG: ABC transporter ATP-binding protein [Candidatus Hydrogenedentes bacterium]|nr:ABC transporter ATP-binding protein [Candidatus Hydrogenedentota bacterium]